MLARKALSRVTLVGCLAFASLQATQLLASGGSPPAAQDNALRPPRLAPYPSLTTAGKVEFRGTAHGATWVEVASRTGKERVPVQGRQFQAAVVLAPDAQNRIAFASIAANGDRSSLTMARVVHDTERPFVAVDYPTRDTDLGGLATVDVSGRVGDRLTGELGLTVTVNGVQAQVRSGLGVHGTFYAEGVPLATGSGPGPVVAGGGMTATMGGASSPAIHVVAVDSLGNVEEVTVAPRQVVTKPPVTVGDQTTFGRIEVVSGSGQSAPVDSLLPQPIVARVLDPSGAPIASKLVTFRATRSNGQLSGKPLVHQAFTDAMGRAQALWRLGTDAGFGNNVVVATSKDIAGFAVFTASATPGPPSQVNVSAGNQQRVPLGGTAPLPLRAWVNDSCNGVDGQSVTFTVVRGDGTVDGASQVTKPTSPSGYVEVAFAVGTTAGNNVVEADFPGNPGLPATFTVQGVAQDQPTTTMSGVVIDNGLRPIQGATVLVEDLTGLVVDTTTTDADGYFTFPDLAFAGIGHLVVDGSTGGAYPHLEYEVDVIANAANAIPLPIKLPALDPVNEVVYDGSTPVTLTVAGVEGLAMHVAPNTVVTLHDGTVVGPDDPGSVTLMLNQVHHDDVPMPMTDGASPPFAWTLQPAGATFDPPLAITYPNMSGLPPGALSAFLSFDHDLGEFRIIGTGQVTPDGALIRSDPGIGIAEAGWGCNCPPYGITADCELCVETCVDNGMLSGGMVAVDDPMPNLGDTVVFTATGVMDSGGEKTVDCPDGSGMSVPIPPGTVTYSYEVTPPSGAVVTGSGSSVSVMIDCHGTYVARFMAEADRECPPAPLVVGEASAMAVFSGCDDTGAVTATAPALNDIPAAMIAGGGLTRIELSDVEITGCVYPDTNGDWRIRVLTATTTIHWGIRTDFYTEPILPPDAGATINCANAPAAIADMADYEATQGAGPNWHMAAASTAHELEHVDWFQMEILSTWPGIETTIEAHVLGACPAMTQAQAEAALGPYLDSQELAWFNAYGVAPEPPAYAVGQGVLDARIAEIQAWMMANCP